MVVLSRVTRAVSASMLAIAVTVLAWIVFAQASTGRWLFSIDTARPQALAEWIQYSALLPPFAIAGATFALVWSHSGDSRVQS